MKNYRILLLALLCSVIFINTGTSQNDCPAYPKKTKFDTLTYIRTEVPTDGAKSNGIYLGQGTILRNGIEVRPAFIPDNNPTWALAIAHSWNYARNMLGRVEYPQIGYWLATGIQETELACVTGTTWDAAYKESNNMANATSNMGHTGCLQIEGPGSAWGQLNQNYPLGRFPDAKFYGMIEGMDNFETSSLTKAYYDIYTTGVYNDVVGWDVYENIDCSNDDYAYVKTSASGYNGGINAFANNAAVISTGASNDCWGGLTATTANYGNDVAKWISVLENDPGYCEYPAGSSFDSYYNEPMTWAMIEEYIDIMATFYNEVDPNSECKPNAKAKFDALQTGGSVDFQQVGPIIDEVILCFPSEYPQTVEGSPMGIDITGAACSGDRVPYGHFKILNGATHLCLGQSVTLELVVDGGEGANPTFKWYKENDPGNILSTNAIYTITPNAEGEEVYAGEICNDKGCYKLNCKRENPCMDPRNICGVKITTVDCGLCPFTAQATAVNTTCKGTSEGSISLALTNDPANYRVDYIANTPLGEVLGSFTSTGNTVNVDGIRDGSYNFILTDLADTTCKAYTNVIVGYDHDLNEYVEASLNGVADCVADVEANIKELPRPCAWRVVSYSTPTFQWENPVNFGVVTSTGKSSLDRWNWMGRDNSIDQWTDVQKYEKTYYLETGQSMDFYIALTNTPGATQWYNYVIKVYDEADNLVYDGNAPAGSAVYDGPFNAGTFTATCPDLVPDYTFSWSPDLANKVETGVKSEGEAAVKGNDITYVVTATKGVCQIVDSVTVLGDPDCSSSCANPGTVTLADAADVDLTDTVSVCNDTTIYTKLDGNDAGTFRYELFLDDVAQTPTNTTGEFTITDEGEYYVLVSDDSDPTNTDCQVKSTILQLNKIVAPNAPLYVAGDSVVCAGSEGVDYEVTLEDNATYEWYYTGTGVAFNPLDPTSNTATINYDVNASDGDLVIKTFNDCGADSLVVSIQIEEFPVVDLGNDTTICAANGALTLDADNPGATYEWQDASTGQTFDVTTTGTYWAKASFGSCSDSDSVAITVAGSAILELGNDTSICDDGITLDVGLGFTTHIWNDASTNQTLDVTVTGIYSVEVEDNNGCVGRDTIEVSIGTSPAVELGNDTSICAAGGALTLDAGNPTAAYVWEPNFETTQTIDVSTTGEYKVQVTENGCSTRDSIQITVLGAVVLDLGPDTSFCSDLGDIILDANAGFDTYSWDNGANTQTITVSASGTYDVEVVDAAGCIARDTIEVTIHQAPTVALGGDASICMTSPAVTFDAGNSGATYLWSSGETTQTITKGNAEAGDYSVIVTNNGCIGRDTITLTVSTELAVDLGEDIEICEGTDTLLNAGFGPGYTFDWNSTGPGNDQTQAFGGGEVIVVVADAGGCDGRDTIVITEVNPLSIDLGNDREMCIGDPDEVMSLVSGRTDVNVLGWNDASTGYTLTTGTTGEYWIEVDSSGCTARDTVELLVNSLPTVSLGNDTFMCAGVLSTLTIDAGDFVSYQWADVTNSLPLGTIRTQDITAIGIYGVAVVDTNGCSNGDQIEVLEESATDYSLGSDTTICPAGLATISVPNGLQTANNSSWQWLNDGSTGIDFVIANQVDGNVVNVILEYSNEFGCLSNDTVRITVDNTLPITSIQDTSICEGDDVVFETGYSVTGYTYTWFDGSTDNEFAISGATPADEGTISVSIVSDEGCTGSASAFLTVNELPTPSITDGSICVGQKTILDHGITNATSLWSPTNETTQSIEVTVAGLYSVTVTNTNGCVGTASANLVVNTPPSINLGADQVLCEGESFPLSTGYDNIDYSHQWNQASSATVEFIDVVANGDYGVIVTDVLTGCSHGDTINFVFNKVPNLELGNDTNICVGESVTLSASEQDAAYTYNWSSGEVTGDLTVNASNLYSLTVANGDCETTDGITVTVNPLPVSDLIEDTTLCFEDLPDGLNLDPGRNGIGFQWGTGAITQVINVQQAGTYVVEITNGAGCTLTDQVTIKEDCPAAIWLPNSFTPSNDGLNENWEIKGRGVESVELLVFNRWGELIWTGEAIGESWDGTYEATGNPVQQDVYVYKLSYKYINVAGNLKSKFRVGSVAVIR